MLEGLFRVCKLPTKHDGLEQGNRKETQSFELNISPSTIDLSGRTSVSSSGLYSPDDKPRVMNE